MVKLLPAFENGYTPKVLLIGNGINRAFGKPDWSDLLDDKDSDRFTEKEKKQIELMPFPLQAVLFSDDSVDDVSHRICKQMIQADVSEEQSELIRELIGHEYDAILTTNYSYEIEHALYRDFTCNIGCACKYRYKTCNATKREDQYGFFTYNSLNDSDKIHNIWHIHGEASKPKSIILGHYYYGEVLSYIRNYQSTAKRKYEISIRYGTDYTPYSWIDYFLLGDVKIVGCGLDPSEMDLWWLINCKAKNFEKAGSITWYEANLNIDRNFAKRSLADTYKMHIVTEDVKEDYRGYYSSVVRSLPDAAND